jgi:hypothetical protein
MIVSCDIKGESGMEKENTKTLLKCSAAACMAAVLFIVTPGCGAGTMYDVGRDPIVKHMRSGKGSEKCKAGKRTYHLFFVVVAGGDVGLDEVMKANFSKPEKIELDEKTKVGETSYKLLGYKFTSDECAWKIQEKLESIEKPRITYRGTMLFFDTLAISVEGTAQIVVSGKATPGAKVYLYDDNGKPVEFTVDSEGNFSGPISVSRGQEYVTGYAEYKSETGETVREELSLPIFE